MDDLIFAAIADDDTGATDLAGMLAGQGVRTLLVIDLPRNDQFLNWSQGYQAVIIAAGTRNLSPALASERTHKALDLADLRRPRVVQVKYCSTFDSTSAGNIGPAIDAALDHTGEAFTIAVPALPINGRTTYQGYLFVHRQLLSDSPMRHHPLTPMTNPNLVDLLSQQTRRRVGLAAYAEVEAGAQRLRECLQSLRAEGLAIAVVDCLNDRHVETICRAAADLRVITGSSAFGMQLPAMWRECGWLKEATETPSDIPATVSNHGCLLIAGSCSAATRRQNEWFVTRGAMAVQLDPRDLLNGSKNRMSVIREVCGELSAGRHCLVFTSAVPEDVRHVQEWGARQGLSVSELGEVIARAMAELTHEILQRQEVGGLIVAGGETSTVLCRQLGLGALQVGRNIQPGVPLCLSLGRRRLPIVLKSGNFGAEDFYGAALLAVAHSAEFLG